MRVLWSKGPASVREVRDALKPEHESAYTTVQTILGILEKKGYVAARKTDRAFSYRALMTERDARAEALKALVSDFFGGSPEALAQHLVEDTLDPDEAARLEALLVEAEKRDE